MEQEAMNICYKCIIISCFFELSYTSNVSDTCAWFSWNNWIPCGRLVIQQRDNLSRVDKRVIKSHNRLLMVDKRAIQLHDRLLMVDKRMIQSRYRLLMVDKRMIQSRDVLLMVDKRMIQSRDRLFMMDQSKINSRDRPYTVSKRAGNPRFNLTLLMCQRQSMPRRMCPRYPNVSGEALNNS